MGKRPTIQMVADLAGVSRGTVDRVLNERSYVSAQVRERVLSAIRETGYISPQEAHRGQLRQAFAPLTLGVLLPNWENQFRTEVDRGIALAQAELEDSAVRVLVRRCRTDLPQEAKAVLCGAGYPPDRPGGGGADGKMRPAGGGGAGRRGQPEI